MRLFLAIIFRFVGEPWVLARKFKLLKSLRETTDISLLRSPFLGCHATLTLLESVV